MNTYVTAAAVRSLRENAGLTQVELARRIGVTDKAVSKWETGKGLPDISLLQPLAEALGVSVTELMNGEPVTNRNKSANLRRSKMYVCPVCGNMIHSIGDAVISCCGISLPPLEGEEPDEAHRLTVENVEDEQFLTVHHPMTKEHHISFVSFVTTDRIQTVKFYPEGEAQTRMQLRGMGTLYWYCNKHGLFKQKK